MPDRDHTRSVPLDGPDTRSHDPVTSAPTEAPTPRADAGPPPTAVGRYVLGAEIARGGMGVVFRAADTYFGREVAIKVLQEKFGAASGAARRFADEARITGQLQHPAIPPVFDLGALPDGRPFLAMKLVRGQTLDALLRQRPDPTAERGRFVAAFEQVCQALAYAHAHKVIHRDLKPSNVMVGNYGEIQVMDWGLAKVLGPRGADESADPAATAIQGSREADAALTQAGSVLGTPAFMPPEQAVGAISTIDTRSDVFGLGAVLAVILTGAPPFTSGSAESTRIKSAQGKVDECFARLDACGAEPELVALCKRCLAPKKTDRPADADAVAKIVAALRQAADERVRQAELDRVRVEGERVAAEARAAERRKRRRVWQGAAAVLVVAVVGGLGAVLAVQRRANADLVAKNDELADERSKVEKRFELAQKAIAKLHTGVGEDIIVRSDQFKELRTQLLKEAAEFYGDLEQLLAAASDAKSRRLLADGYFQLAELTGKIGSKTEAVAIHSKALAIRQELAAADGADVETRLDVPRSLGAMAYLLGGTGDANGALRCYAEQRALAESLQAEAPTEAVRHVLAQSLTSSSWTLWQERTAVEALAASTQAVAILRELVGANPTAPLQSDLARSLMRTAIILRDLGKWAEALAMLETARALFQKLADDNSGSIRFRYRLAVCLTNIGNQQIEVGWPEPALAVIEQARALTQELLATHRGATEFQHTLALNYLNRGRALAELDRPTEATAAFRTALDIWQKLVAASSTDVTSKYFGAYCQVQLANLLAQTGHSSDALRTHEAARPLLAQLAADHPNFHWVQRTRAFTLDNTGLLLSAAGQSDEALASCRQALVIRQALRDEQPAVTWVREEMAGTLSRLGIVQRRAGRPAEAVASFRDAIALMEPLPTPKPRNLYHLAGYRALLAGVAADAESGLTADAGTAEAARAMTALREAYATGFGNVVTLRTDPSLDALRPRSDFQELVKELEAKAPKSPEPMPPPREKGPRPVP